MMAGDHSPEVPVILPAVDPAIAVESFLPTARGQTVLSRLEDVSVCEGGLIEARDNQQLIASLSSSEGDNPGRVQSVDDVDVVSTHRRVRPPNPDQVLIIAEHSRTVP